MSETTARKTRNLQPKVRNSNKASGIKGRQQIRGKCLSLMLKNKVLVHVVRNGSTAGNSVSKNVFLHFIWNNFPVRGSGRTPKRNHVL